MDDQHVVRQCILQASCEGEPNFALADPASVEEMSLWLISILGLHFRFIRLPADLEQYLNALMGARALVMAEGGWAPIPDRKLVVRTIVNDADRLPQAAKRQMARLRERLKKWQVQRKLLLVDIRPGHGKLERVNEDGVLILEAVPTYYRLHFFEQGMKLVKEYQAMPERTAAILRKIAKQMEAKLAWPTAVFNPDSVDPDRALHRIYSKIQTYSRQAFDLSSRVGQTEDDMEKHLLDKVKESRTDQTEAVVELD